MSEQIVTVLNSAAQALHCMLEEPAAGPTRRDVACLLLSPGVKMRVAPHRLYRKLASVFLERGMPVMRVDFHGLGDSGGELAEVQLDQLYRQVQLGRHVDDVLSAMNYLSRQHGIRKFVVGGLCGGAITGLLAAERDPRIIGLYAIGIPVVLDGTGAHESVNMSRGQLGSLRERYVRKIFSPSAWGRFLSLRSDYRLIFASLRAKLGRRKRFSGAAGATDGVPAPTVQPAANLNHGFVRALFRMLRERSPVLLLFSGADRLQWELQEKFIEPWAQALESVKGPLTLETIPSANHVLGHPAWVAEARQRTAAWLDSRFPPP